MPAPSYCTITGVAYKEAPTAISGDPILAPGSRLIITPLSVTGNIISSAKATVISDPVTAMITIIAVQGSTINIAGAILGYNSTDGTNILVPSASTATLESLTAVATVPTDGLTIQDEGVTIAGLFGTLNFVGTGVAAVQASAGIATITITAGAGVTAEEVDGTPTYPSSSTLRFDQADGFVLTQPAANITRIDLANVPLSVLASLPLVAANNLSDLVNAGTARSSLGLVIGTNVQAWSADLDAIDALAGNAGFLKKTALNTWSLDMSTYLTSVQDGAADGATKGVAAFVASDFDSAAGVISLDFANAQKASGSVPGFLSSADWTTFNDKQPALGFTAVPNTRTVNGHALSGNISVTASDVGLGSVENTALSTWAGSANLTTLGTIGTGSWNATIISLAKGGTGVALSDPGAHTLLGWDDTDGAVAFITVGSGLTYTQATHTLSASGGSGATVALDNLSAVAINTDLLPASTQGLGNASFPFLASFTGNTTQYERVQQSAGLITHAALGSATDIGFALTPKGTGKVTVSSLLTVSAVGGFTVGNVSALARIQFNTPTVDFSFITAANTPAGLLAASIGNSAGVQINNGTAGQWGSLFCGLRDAGTVTLVNGITIEHQSTGTPAAGLGIGILHNLPSSTTAAQAAGQFFTRWNVSTHAARTARAGISTNLVGLTTLVERFITGGHTVVVTNNAALSLFDIALPTLTGCSGRLTYTVFAADTTDVQVRRGIVEYSSVNKAAAYQTADVVIVSEAASVSTGTLTATFALVSGSNLVTLQITPNSSLTATTYFVKWELANLSESAITIA